MFCEIVKVDMKNSKEKPFKKSISSTLSLITVLFEDLFDTITLHREYSSEKCSFEPSTSLLNETNTCDGHDFNIDIFTDEVNAFQKYLLVLFEESYIFGHREVWKSCFVYCWQLTRPYMAILDTFQTNFWKYSLRQSRNQKSYESPSGCP
jgi:hypothetical protein